MRCPRPALLVLPACAVLAACGPTPHGTPSDTAGSMTAPQAVPSPLAEDESAAPPPPAPASADPAPAHTAAAPATPAPPAQLSEADKGEKGARAVLLTWARALENRQFDTAWAQFRHPQSSREAFVRWWGRYRTITVAVPGGEMDAGAGSLYYTAPATLTGTRANGGPFRLEGTVVLRRVNDVDGASPAQLRWGIESADLKDVAPG